MESVIRAARRDERPIASALVHAAGLPIDGLDRATLLLIAERDGQLVGTAALERHGHPEHPVFLLRSVAVAERGRSIGTRLVAAALDEVDRHVAPVALLTETAADWFPRFGFERVARSALPTALSESEELRGACPASAVALLRPAGVAPGHIATAAEPDLRRLSIRAQRGQRSA